MVFQTTEEAEGDGGGVCLHRPRVTLVAAWRRYAWVGENHAEHGFTCGFIEGEGLELEHFMACAAGVDGECSVVVHVEEVCAEDRKSTRMNSSHVAISYAVFCLKKKRM